ncbi:hypothetical protein F4777DRAFT_579670 [Nemania sp. FL0916]|nr:hypothetical protein F4777DRAFT_579670 [Nemania sp. FL0916]
MSANEAIRSHPSPLGPATGGRFYAEDKQCPSIVFMWCQYPYYPALAKCQDWEAILQVKCPDVPRLMREGFHWDVSNVIKEEGFMEWTTKTRSKSPLGAASKRSYFLTDTHESPRWKARLIVYSWDLNFLYDFDVRQLSRSLISSTRAFNQEGRQIYGYKAHTAPGKLCYCAESPMSGFNIIYDKMPLEGLWPWPTKENEAHTKDDVAQGAIEKADSGSLALGSSQNQVQSNDILKNTEEDGDSEEFCWV